MNIRSAVALSVGLGGLILAEATASGAPLCGARGDGNGDCRISLEDLADLTACLQGPAVLAPPTCACYDFDVDGDVDMVDAQRFQQDFTGLALIAGCVTPPRLDEPGTLRPAKAGSPGGGDWGIEDVPISDSVYLFSGEFHLTAEDMRIPGRGFDFSWTRRYRSRIGSTTTMGAGWDHSYNISLVQAGANLILFDGDGRQDEYCPNAGGTWTHPEFFREIVATPVGYDMVFHDRSVWRFHGFAGFLFDGKIESMTDRNGNRMTFVYDVAGRLIEVHDTLDNAVNARVIAIAYNPDGFVSSVTDFAGRQVLYTYYQNPDIGGDFGDLRTVRSPVVVGTPNGNDFPGGKTTTYTYTEAFPDPRLNHNLLTVTDPAAQTYLSNTYAPTLNPLDLEYDRVLEHRLGSPVDVTSFFYQTLAPDAANNFSTMRCIVNDRMGNVSECFYDYRNRLAMLRQFTGRANPVNQTTDLLNRPVNPLRATDPPLFETRRSYNDESLLTRVISPELDELEFDHTGDINYFAAQRERAEVRVERFSPGPRGGAQPQIVQQFEFDAALNFDTSQVTRWTDAKGNDTTYDYDQAGNCIRVTHRIPSIVEEFTYNPFGQMTSHLHPDNGSGSLRRDEWTFYPQAAGPQFGYVNQFIVDAGGFALTTTYEYDSVGNITRVIDANGGDTLYDVNQLNQTVRTRSREVVPGGGPRYERLTFYDANDNVVRIDTENRDENGVLQANTHFTTIYDYEILNFLTRVTEEVDPVNNVVTEFEYDANRNQTGVRLGEATNGNQLTNTVTTLYDERDLVFREIRANGDPDESTTQFDYDQNCNVIRCVQGIQGAMPRESRYEYDGYDRQVRSHDSMGNERQYDYDANSNQTSVLTLGELFDVPGSAGNLRLSEVTLDYDAYDRLTLRDEHFFDAAQNPLTDGFSTTLYDYSDSSHILLVTDDNLHTYQCVYDTANRKRECTDAKGNTIRYTYDNNSNVVTEDETDKSDLGLPDEVFTTTYEYDGLDRLTRTIDNAGNANVHRYDSRDLEAESIDALGNIVQHDYDGLDRLTQSVRVLTDTGNGGGIVIGAIVDFRVWDDSSRLVQHGDGNGNSTVYVYDPLNRHTFTNFADGSSEVYVYDVHGNKIAEADANGTQVNYAYDLSNRQTGTGVIVAPGVSNDTTFETYDYDGLNRLVRAEDDDSVVTREYDSLSNRVSETLNGVTSIFIYDGARNQVQCFYPNGRTIDYAYDDLDRVQNIADGVQPVANQFYVGPDRVQFSILGNGANTNYQYDGVTGVPNPPGDFGVKQPIFIQHDHPGLGVTIDAREFQWDPLYNRTNRVDPLGQLAHTYEYDSVYRLRRTVVDDLFGGVVIRDTQYQLDNVGNRLSVVNDNCSGLYAMNPGNPPADFQMNQYTATGCDNRFYDANGNLTDRTVVGPVARNTYDYMDRLIRNDDVPTGVATEMSYDALGRRISMSVSAAAPINRFDYYYNGAQVIEEQDTGGLITTYVYSDDVDQVVQMQQSTGDTYYYHRDDQDNVMALTDSNGFVAERYDYQDYGQPEFYDAAGIPIAGSAVRNSYLFTGRRYDSTTGLYYYRARYLDPVAGRFIQRDPLGIWGDPGNIGNATTYAASNPWTKTDPTGMLAGGDPLKGLNVGHSAKNCCSRSDCPKALKGPSKDNGGGGGGYGSRSLEHRGHVTVLKSAGSGSDVDSAWETCSGGSLNIAMGGGYNGHVTVLKARDRAQKEVSEAKAAMAGAGGGGGTRPWDVDYDSVNSRAPGEGADYNSSRSNKSHGIAPPPPGGGGTLRGNKLFVGGFSWGSSGGGGGRGASKHRHRGHVTVLKLAGSAGGGSGGADEFHTMFPVHRTASTDAQDYNSSRSNNINGIVAPPPGGGGGGRGPGDRKYKHRGHVTVLK